MKNVKVRIAIVATLFLLAYMLILWLIFPPPIPRWQPEPLTPERKAWLQERFRYHGIEAAICEGEVCWFIREGRRCRL